MRLPRFLRREKRNRVRDLTDPLLQEGRDSEIEAALARFDPEHLRDEELETWHQLHGVAAFQRGDRPAALERFAEGHAACPDAESIRFSLAQELQHVGRVEEAFSHFDRCDLARLSGQHTMVATRYAYLWGEFERGLTYLQPILAAYDQLGIVDDHFLYMRNLPFFGTTWATLGALHELGGSLDAFHDFTERATQELREYDFDEIEAFAMSLRSMDFRPVIDRLAALVVQNETNGVPTGYAAMQRSTLRAVTTEDLAPNDVLASVTLTDRDFPWLEDIRTLALACVAHARSESVRELELREAFRAKQPLLFEPHHAFDFRVLEYQETLRPEYQAECRARSGAA